MTAKFFSSARKKRLCVVFAVIFVVTLLGPSIDSAEAHRFGFRGGFRGGFGRSFASRRGFGVRRFRSFNRFRFRGFRGFGRSRFNSLAFRGRRFGFGRFNRFRRFGFAGRRSRFVKFRPRYSSFAFSHFPVRRFHSGFQTFKSVPVRSYKVVNNYRSYPNYNVSYPTYTVAGTGWNHLAGKNFVNARNAFVNDIAVNKSAGSARVGFALAAASNGELDKGVWAMRRAFDQNSNDVASMMLDDGVKDTVVDVTRLYEERMEKGGNKNDDAFMLTALYQMQGDPEMASMAMEYVVTDGQLDAAARNLKRLVDSEMDAVPMSKGRAWDLLAAGNSRNALNEFVREISRDETNGQHKVGYAIAIADQGDLARGAWAMRRAFGADAEGTSDMMLSGNLRKTVERVSDLYAKDAELSGFNNDNAYMLAALYLLQGDVEGAELMTKNCAHDPDCFVLKMITQEMDAQTKLVDEVMTVMKTELEEVLPEPGVRLLDQDLAPQFDLPLVDGKVERDLPSEEPPVHGPELPPDFKREPEFLDPESGRDEVPESDEITACN